MDPGDLLFADVRRINTYFEQIDGRTHAGEESNFFCSDTRFPSQSRPT